MSKTVDLFGNGPTATDAAFRHISESSRAEPQEARALIESLWRKTANYLEDGIPNRLRFELHSCFWEMYLAAVLLDQKLPVAANDIRRHQGGKGPDIQVGSVEAWFEATAATAGEGPDAVPGYSFEGFAPVPDEPFKLRLTAAVQEKFRKFQHYINKGLVSESEPFVIAVNGGGVPHVYQESFPPRIVCVLFPFGAGGDTLRPSDKHVWRELFHVPRRGQEKERRSIPATFFEQEASHGISTVLYSTAEAFNCGGVLGYDLTLVHNPLATSPLPRGLIRVGHEWWRDGDHLVRHDHNPPAAAEAS